MSRKKVKINSEDFTFLVINVLEELSDLPTSYHRTLNIIYDYYLQLPKEQIVELIEFLEKEKFNYRIDNPIVENTILELLKKLRGLDSLTECDINQQYMEFEGSGGN